MLTAYDLKSKNKRGRAQKLEDATREDANCVRSKVKKKDLGHFSIAKQSGQEENHRKAIKYFKLKINSCGDLKISGLGLTMYYSPSVVSAFSSVLNIFGQVYLGWLNRSIHRWSCFAFGSNN